jgi:hypothetical protein
LQLLYENSAVTIEQIQKLCKEFPFKLTITGEAQSCNINISIKNRSYGQTTCERAKNKVGTCSTHAERLNREYNVATDIYCVFSKKLHYILRYILEYPDRFIANQDRQYKLLLKKLKGQAELFGYDGFNLECPESCGWGCYYANLFGLQKEVCLHTVKAFKPQFNHVTFPVFEEEENNILHQSINLDHIATNRKNGNPESQIESDDKGDISLGDPTLFRIFVRETAAELQHLLIN